MKKYNKTIFIFRKDYRLQDNIGLIMALQLSKIVIPVFILTPEQLINNKYKSDNAVQFMIESLIELDNDLRQKANSRLFFFMGKPHEVIQNIFKNEIIDTVIVNKDYTPYSKIRDAKINKICEKNKVVFLQFEDAVLNNVGSIKNGSGNTYVKFTPYYNVAKKVKVMEPKKNNYKNFYPKKNNITGEYIKNLHALYVFNENLAVNGGRRNAEKILSGLSKFSNYNTSRNFLSMNTTKLSAYIRFGVVSVREVYYAVKNSLSSKNDLTKQLYWRDFYYNIMDSNPQMIISNLKCFKPNYEKVPWITYETATNDERKMWKKWCEGKTGFPIVDAAMRELNVTGFMHNRGRMIVACFLCKNMFFHFTMGERYFAQNLVDHDPSNNNGGWQWAAGSGVDSMPYFRIFNPWTQAEKFDKDCKYIKKWVEELRDVPCIHIHKWSLYHEKYNIYYEPMLDYSESSKRAVKLFKKFL